VQGGPYTLLRHPIYAGYVVSYVAFWLLNPTAYNLAVYVLAIGMILARIAAEERLLSADPLYTAFIHKVRWRLAPGLY
jgi:protein-S-isoprenylcysteine O-methyltransferase Ste14